VAAIDIVSIADLKQWANVSGTASDDLIQDVITGISTFVYTWTGRTPNIFSDVTSLTETYSGSGSRILYLRNFPIVSVSSLVVSGQNIAVSPAWGTPGYFIDDSKKFLTIRPGGGAGTFASLNLGAGWAFWPGIGNIAVTYSAGYASAPEDLYIAVLKMCTVVLNRRLREDQAGEAIPQAGTTSYRTWDFGPDVWSILRTYKRISTT
jgi:hypothetical protein